MGELVLLAALWFVLSLVIAVGLGRILDHRDKRG